MRWERQPGAVLKAARPARRNLSLQAGLVFGVAELYLIPACIQWHPGTHVRSAGLKGGPGGSDAGAASAQAARASNCRAARVHRAGFTPATNPRAIKGATASRQQVKGSKLLMSGNKGEKNEALGSLYTA